MQGDRTDEGGARVEVQDVRRSPPARLPTPHVCSRFKPHHPPVRTYESSKCAARPPRVAAAKISKGCHAIQCPLPDCYLAAGCNDGKLRVADASSAAVVATLDGHSRGVSALAVVLPGSRLASGSSDRRVRVWGVCRTAGSSYGP